MILQYSLLSKEQFIYFLLLLIEFVSDLISAIKS